MSAVSSIDYRSPRSLILSGELTLPEVFEWNAKENPHLPLFRFFDGHHLETITYARAVPGIRRAARYVKSCVSTPDVIAVLANKDTITYVLTCLGILRAGYTMFLISSRNVPAAVADMLRRANCCHMLVSQDEPIQCLAEIVSTEMDGLSLHPMPSFEYILPHSALTDANGPEDLPKEFNPDSLAMILHSSGSTNHPKPIRWSHKRLTRWSTAVWHGEVDFTRAIVSVHSTPMFHAVGVFMYCLAANNGMTLTTFPPTSPPVFPTPEKVFEGITKTFSENVMTAPAMIEMWARDPEKVHHMTKMKAVIYGGAPLDGAVGDTLASRGVTLYSCYGSTEVGAIARFFPVNPGLDWAYFQLTPMFETFLIDAGEGRSELVFISPSQDPLPIINTKVGGRDAYATNDILEPHPAREGWWRYYGRLDDQIVLSNGEKTNPGPLEAIISDDPLVHTCMVFGQGKFQNGVLIDPEPEYRLDFSDISKLQECRNRLWKTVERANAFAPQHSRIFKEMIMFTSPAKPFTYNIKGYPRRKAILKEYQDEIEALYAAVEESAQGDVAAPVTWDYENTRNFLHTVVEKVLNKRLAGEADLFRNGCDSLQATWIRNTILRVVREYSVEAAQRLPVNVVFQAPTISALTDAILSAVHHDGSMQAASTAEDLVKLAERFSANLPARAAQQLRPRKSGKDVVLITGTTGGFGCDVLEHLLRDRRVERVYTFNRLGSDALKRQRTHFRERGLEEALLSSPKFKMVEAVLDKPGFGIEPVLLDEIRDSVTHIMHNAWTVNFNLFLPSFEGDLKGVRNLVELALSSPFAELPRIQFTSSIGIFENCTIQPPVPEMPIEPSSALGSGYAESKWISEQILSNATERAGVPITIVRLGQISGDQTGHWNEREWFPALVKSALFTRCLPDVEGEVSFILGYPAARAFVEMRNSAERILHLVHPRRVPWHAVIAPIAAELEVPLVSYPTWLAALEKIAGEEEASGSNVETMRDNPALRLLDFFRTRKAVQDGREPMGLPHLCTNKARAASETLEQMPALAEADIRRWLEGWRASGFLPGTRK